MKKLLSLVTFFFCGLSGWGQSATVKHPSGESLSVHINASLFVTGESLLFKVYCLQDGKLSPLSKIAYVELIGENAKPALQTKIELADGEGSGSFYFPSNIPSGNYTLLAYTKWMKNASTDSFYRTNIVLINPRSLPPASSDSVGQRDRTSEIVTAAPKGVTVDKGEYNQRERVTLSIAVLNDTTKMSVSVRLLTNQDSNSAMKMTKEGDLSQIDFVPDYRGELLSGTVSEKATGKPVHGALVSLSIPSENYTFLVSRTNEKGRYAFNLRNLKGQIYLRTINHPMEDVVINVDDPYLHKYDDVRPKKLFLDTALLKSLGRTYLASQVQNAFQRTETDSARSIAPLKQRFFANPGVIYRLDDFARFPTMEDVFREIVPEVIVKLKDGKFSLSMRNNITAERFYNSPLMLIDGIPVMDANVIMNYDPLLVKDIAILAQRYYYGGLETEGIISIETYSGKAERLDTTDMLVIAYEPPQKYVNDMDGMHQDPEADNRIPDYRTQLYWNPFLEVKSTKTLVFSTGDVAGTYVVDVAGVNTRGEFIKFQTTFKVK